MGIQHTDQLHWPLLGNTPVKRLLQSAVSHQKVAHAYLFVGPSHVGKYATATVFANSLICQSKDQRRPCNQCPACDQFTKGIHPDVDIIQPNENQSIPISQIRALQHKMSLRSFLTEYKIAVINSAEGMTEESANALLKTLEEPTPKTVFILVAESKDALPKTIASRCQIVQFTLTQNYQIENWLIVRGIEKKKASLIAHYANGCPGTAVSLIESQQPIHEYQDRVKTLMHVLDDSFSARLSVAHTLTREQPGEKNTAEVENTLNAWITFFRDLLFISNNMPAPVNIPAASPQKILDRRFTPKKICQTIECMLSTKQFIRQNANPRLVMENLLLSL